MPTAWLNAKKSRRPTSVETHVRSLENGERISVPHTCQWRGQWVDQWTNWRGQLAWIGVDGRPGAGERTLENGMRLAPGSFATAGRGLRTGFEVVSSCAKSSWYCSWYVWPPTVRSPQISPCEVSVLSQAIVSTAYFTMLASMRCSVLSAAIVSMGYFAMLASIVGEYCGSSIAMRGPRQHGSGLFRTGRACRRAALQPKQTKSTELLSFMLIGQSSWTSSSEEVVSIAIKMGWQLRTDSRYKDCISV